MIELQDIFRLHGDEFRAKFGMNFEQAKAFRDIMNCRTVALGAHIDVCDECGFERISYNSCRNRHCPKCQTTAKEQWIAKQEQDLLNIGYFHVVFTVPDDLNPVFYQNQAVMYNLFFKCVSETLMELCNDKKFLGAKPGITAVLHTWGQNLLYHPHIHCVVSGGGLTADGKWKYSRKKFLLPVKVLSKKFRGKFLHHLKRAKLNFFGRIEEFNTPGCFDSFVSGLYNKSFVTYCKPPFGSPAKVVNYLGRYTHRVAISNNRILKLEDGKVTFNRRDYRDGNKVKQTTIAATEFIRRFMLHVLPSGFRKIRHYGIVASRDKTARLKLCRKLTNTKLRELPPLSALELLRSRLGADFNLCPCCGVGHLARASPSATSA